MTDQTLAPITKDRTRLRWRRLVALAGIAVVLGAAALGTTSAPPRVLVNGSPSEPPGVYVRTGEQPSVGHVVAFRLPPTAYAYVERAMPYLRRRPLLKAVAAGPGDAVCTLQGRLVVNGAVRAPIATQDRHGQPLPQWSECRRLGPNELFVFSDRVPNSFDSRYYGPVTRGAVLGVYRQVASLPEDDA